MVFHKKSQAFYIDLFLGTTIFLIGLTLLMKTSLNLDASEEELYNRIKMEGSLLSNMLLSEGYPNDWNRTTVRQIGILSGNQIDEDKVEELKALDYANTKNLFRTGFDYYFFLYNGTDNISISGVSGIGHNQAQPFDPPDTANNIFRINRFTIYDDSIVNLVILIWD